MLPARTSLRQASWWVFLHTSAAGLVALLLVFTPQLGRIYFIPVIIVTIDMIVRNIRLIRNTTPRNARALFMSSNIYLTVVLVAICLGSVLHNVWAIL
jgi:heme O synthase-like polyprenyltransferase